MEPQHPSYRDNLNSNVAQILIDEAHAYANTQRDRADRLKRSRDWWRVFALTAVILSWISLFLFFGLTPGTKGPEFSATYVDAGHESISGVEVRTIPTYCHLALDPLTVEDPFASMHCVLFPNTLFSFVRREPARIVCTHGQYCLLHRACPLAPHWHPVRPLIPDLHLTLSP